MTTTRSIAGRPALLGIASEGSCAAQRDTAGRGGRLRGCLVRCRNRGRRLGCTLGRPVSLASALLLVLSLARPDWLPFAVALAGLCVLFGRKANEALVAGLLAAAVLCLARAYPSVPYHIEVALQSVSICGHPGVSPLFLLTPLHWAAAIGWLMVGWRRGLVLLLALLSCSAAFAAVLTAAQGHGALSLATLSCAVYWAHLLANSVGVVAFALLAVRPGNGLSRWRLNRVHVAVLFPAWGLLLFASTWKSSAFASGTRASPPRVVFWEPVGEPRSDPGNQMDLFSSFRTLLARAGFAVERRQDLAGGGLDDVSVLCVLMPARSPDKAEAEAIRLFIRGGGHALVAAEHTNMDGVKTACDGLLAPYGIAVNFDTATSLMGNLISGTRSSQGALGNLLGHCRTLAYNRGASLSLLGRGAVPLLTGHAWHSDAGVAGNAAGAFLGDGKWSAGDRLGNVVLAASSGGWVPSLVVFGDTSPFIDRNASHNASFILDLFRLLGSVPRPDQILAVAGSGLALVLVLALGYASSLRLSSLGGDGLPMGGACSAVLLASLVLLRVERPPSVPGGPQPVSPRLVVSTEEQNLFSRDPSADESVVSLVQIAEEAGFLCSVGSWRDTAGIDRLFVINPTRPVRLGEMLAHVQDGGSVIVSGSGDNPHFLRVLARLGRASRGIPLGRLRGEDFDTVSGWGISHAETTGRHDIRAGDTVVGTSVEVDGRRVVLLADSGFFRTKDLETGDDAGRRAWLVGRLLDE